MEKFCIAIGAAESINGHELIVMVMVMVSHNRPRWPKGVRVG